MRAGDSSGSPTSRRFSRRSATTMLRRPMPAEADVAPSVRFQTSDAVDFVVVGSGAAGGIIAKELSTAGYSVVVLEQGPRVSEAQYDHDEFATFMQGRTANSMATQPQTFRATPADKV